MLKQALSVGKTAITEMIRRDYGQSGEIKLKWKDYKH